LYLFTGIHDEPTEIGAYVKKAWPVPMKSNEKQREITEKALSGLL